MVLVDLAERVGGVMVVMSISNGGLSCDGFSSEIMVVMGVWL